MAYRRRGGPRGRKCIRRKRVRVRGHGMALRCVKYGAKRSSRSTRSRRSGGKKSKLHRGMARKGGHCTRRKYVYSRVLRKRVRRCASYR